MPFQFIWSPKEFSETLQTVTDHTVLDFGFVKQGGAVRYTLRAVGDNFASERVTYEIAWDGGWSDNLDVMAGHLTIRRVTQDE